MTAVAATLHLLPRGRLDWGRGLRMAAAMVAPLVAGLILGHGSYGLLAGVGAFIVASTDTGARFAIRARIMAVAAVAVAGAYLVGSLAGASVALATIVVAVSLFAAGLVAVLGAAAGVVSTMASVAAVIGVFVPGGAASAARDVVLLLIGGSWALVLSLAGWPLDPRRPVRRKAAAAISACAAFLNQAGGGRESAAAREACRAALADGRAALEQPRLTDPDTVQVRDDRTARIAAVVHATGALFNALVALDQRARAEYASEDAQPSRDAITRTQAVLHPALMAAAAAVRRHDLPPPASATPVAAEQILSQAADGFGPAVPTETRGALHRAAEAAATLTEAVAGHHADDRWLAATATPPAAPRRRVIAAQLTLASPVLRYAARLALAGAIAVLAAHVFDPAHGAWLVSSTVLVLKPNLGATLRTATARSVATVAGAAAAAGLVALEPPTPVLVVFAFGIVAVAMAVISSSYGLGVLVVTPLSMVLSAIFSPVSWVLAVQRVTNIATGCLIAIVIGWAAWPGRLADRLPGQIETAFTALRHYLAEVSAGLAVPAGAPEDPAGVPARVHASRSGAEAACAAVADTARQLRLEPGGRGRLAGSAAVAADDLRGLLDAIVALDQRAAHSQPPAPPGGTDTAPRHLADTVADRATGTAAGAHGTAADQLTRDLASAEAETFALLAATRSAGLG